MAFHSFAFLLLFPPAAAAYRWSSTRFGRHWANWFLLAASAAFYVQGSPGNGALLAASIVFNYLMAQRMGGDENRSRMWLWIGITGNIVFLSYFKYAGLVGAWKVGFPLGISFFTIQQIMYLVDVHQRLSGASRLFDHALAVCYFPYISAGPITPIRDMLKQLHGPANAEDGSDLAAGLLRFALGLFKKVVLADTVAIVVNAGFGAPAGISMVEGWLTCFLYTLQIYLDFSGYSDMAIGAARMLGHVVPENFNHPLRATSITDFWQRWHMTLTNFITHYLYTPLVRSWGKVTRPKAMAATLLAMAIAGIWHGSGATFLIFGFLHGAGLAAHLAWKGAKRKMPNGAGMALTLLLVTFAFLFFRSPDLRVAGDMLAALAGAHSGSPAAMSVLLPALKSNWRITALICASAPLAAFFGPTTTQFAERCRYDGRLAAGVAALLLMSLLFLNSIPDRGFIYVGF